MKYERVVPVMAQLESFLDKHPTMGTVEGPRAIGFDERTGIWKEPLGITTVTTDSFGEPLDRVQININCVEANHVTRTTARFRFTLFVDPMLVPFVHSKLTY